MRKGDNLSYVMAFIVMALGALLIIVYTLEFIKDPSWSTLAPMPIVLLFAALFYSAFK